MSLAGVSCLVTGAGGFLGQRIVRLLLEEEEALAEIRLLDKAFSEEALGRFEKFRGKTEVKILEGDIRDVTFLHRACQGVSLVIHTASLIDTLGLIEKKLLWEVNVTGTQLLLEACVRCSVQHFIYTSTIEVTGPNCRGDPIFNGDEDTAYESVPKSPYAQSKRLAEDSVLKADGQVLKDGGTLMTCALRSMYIFGEGCPFLQGHLDKCLLNQNVYLRFSRKEALVNPVYVGNIAWAHVQAAKALRVPQKAKHVRGKFYYISDDTPHMSYADLNYELTKDLGFGIEPQLPMPLTMLYYFSLLLEIVSFLLRPFVRYIPSTNRHLVTLLNTPFTFSYRKAQRDFGYVPRYTWEEAKQCTVPVSRVIVTYSIFWVEEDDTEALKSLFQMNAVILSLPRELSLVHLWHVLPLIGLYLATSLESIIFRCLWQCLILFHVLRIVCQGTFIFIPAIRLLILMKPAGMLSKKAGAKPA